MSEPTIRGTQLAIGLALFYLCLCTGIYVAVLTRETNETLSYVAFVLMGAAWVLGFAFGGKWVVVPDSPTGRGGSGLAVGVALLATGILGSLDQVGIVAAALTLGPLVAFATGGYTRFALSQRRRWL